MSIILLSSKYLTRTMYIDVYSLAYTPDLVVEFCSQILLSKNINVKLGSTKGNMCIILTRTKGQGQQIMFVARVRLGQRILQSSKYNCNTFIAFRKFFPPTCTYSKHNFLGFFTKWPHSLISFSRNFAFYTIIRTYLVFGTLEYLIGKCILFYYVLSTRIHLENVHENSPKKRQNVSTKIHHKCPREITKKVSKHVHENSL